VLSNVLVLSHNPTANMWYVGVAEVRAAAEPPRHLHSSCCRAVTRQSSRRRHPLGWELLSAPENTKLSWGVHGLGNDRRRSNKAVKVNSQKVKTYLLCGGMQTGKQDQRRDSTTGCSLL
jgi:hypothetical protein